MSTIELATSTGIRQVDTILCGVVGMYETVFPDRVRAYYLFGSYTNKSAVAISDIDMGVLFKGPFLDDAEEIKAQQLRQYCSLLSPLRLDIGVASEEAIPAEHVQLKLASVLVFGEDIRDSIPVPTLDAYVSYISNWPRTFVSLVHDQKPIIFPLDYPDPHGEFHGYDRICIPAWYPPSTKGGTKELVAYLCWIATFMIGWKAGVFVGTKADAVRAYKDYINDDFAPLLDVVYHICGQRWAYAIPEQDQERQVLRDVCSKVLAFENSYLLAYRDFLIEQLRSGAVDKQVLAVNGLAETVYVDDEVTMILHSLQIHADDGLKQAAHQTLQTIGRVASF